jgi:hypothetical protein
MGLQRQKRNDGKRKTNKKERRLQLLFLSVLPSFKKFFKVTFNLK